MENPRTQGSKQGGGQPSRQDNGGERESGRRGRQGQSQQMAQQEQPSRSGPGEYLPARRAQHPFAMLAQMSEEMDRLMDSFFGGGWMPRTRLARGASAGTGTWYPSIEVRERDNELVVCAELPGIRKEDVNIEVDEDQLVISGERREESESQEQGWYRSERSYGSFCRTVPLPEGVRADDVRAKLRDGVLEVTVPLQQAQKRPQRRIEVQE